MAAVDAPSKRLKTASPSFHHQEDFVSLGDTGIEHQRQPVNSTNAPNQRHQPYDRRNAQDKPKSKHALPGHEPWVLVKTKLRRRFVHNTQTKESLWRIPKDVLPGVLEFERWEEQQKEKADNAKWAEEQLKQMRPQATAIGTETTNEADRSQRRRSESLQREDEAAALAELAAQAEHDEEQDAKNAVKAVEPLQPHSAGYDSDSSYEEVEVTDSEGEGEGELAEQDDPVQVRDQGEDDGAEADIGADPGPVEFGEDDIAWQLAAMGEDYGLDAGEYGDEPEGGWEEGAEGLSLSDEDATNLFRDLLDDYRVSPFTPWDKIISDESETSILNDDRYTVLSNMKARKDVFDVWAKDKAAEIKAERAAMAKSDPKIPYLAFLQEHATPKLYWPEFKRKFKREAEMNDRKLGDRDREKLYRDHITRLKLPESTRKADLYSLLGKLPLKAFNRDTSLDALPQQLVSNLHYISLPPAARDSIIEAHRRKLPPAPEDDMSEEQRMEEERKREEKRRREQAMANREMQVDEQRRQAEKTEMRAKRDLREGERELQRAMATGNRGLQAQLREGA